MKPKFGFVWCFGRFLTVDSIKPLSNALIVQASSVTEVQYTAVWTPLHALSRWNSEENQLETISDLANSLTAYQLFRHKFRFVINSLRHKSVSWSRSSQFSQFFNHPNARNGLWTVFTEHPSWSNGIQRLKFHFSKVLFNRLKVWVVLNFRLNVDK